MALTAFQILLLSGKMFQEVHHCITGNHDFKHIDKEQPKEDFNT